MKVVPVSYLIKKMIREELGKLQQTITLKIFIHANNEFKSQDTLSIFKTYEENSGDKLRLEIIPLHNNKYPEEIVRIRKITDGAIVRWVVEVAFDLWSNRTSATYT